MKVFFHTRMAGMAAGEGQYLDLSALGRLPVAGDYLQLEKKSGYLHYVEMVIHTAFDRDYVAELFCIQVKLQSDVQSRARFGPE